MLDFKWAIINNLPLCTIADSLVKGLRVTEALPEATKQVIHYFCYSAIEFYFLKVLKSINQFPRSWSGPGLAKTLRSERGEMTHYKCTSGHGASKRLIFWFFNVYERGGITCIWCFACRGRGVACFPNVFQVSAGNTEYGGVRERVTSAQVSGFSYSVKLRNRNAFQHKQLTKQLATMSGKTHYAANTRNNYFAPS